MLTEENKKNTENKIINIEPVSTPKPEEIKPKEIAPIQVEAPISTPQPVEVLENTTIEPEITPKIEVAPEIGKIEQVKLVEPISTEVPIEPKIEENTPVLSETLKEEVKPDEILEQTTNIPIKPTQPEIKTAIENIVKQATKTPEELPPSLPEVTTPLQAGASLPEEKPLAQIPTQNLTSSIFPTKTRMHELFIKAQNAIQIRKRKKLNKIMAMFLKNPNHTDEQKIKITNDEVEKLLHVSDSTATRYLAILKKEGKIKQNGKTGKWVYYTKI